MFDLGIQELVVIFVVALLVFGPKRLPELARTMGKSFGQLRRAMFDIKAEVEREIDETSGEIKHDLPNWKQEIPFNESPDEGEQADIKGLDRTGYETAPDESPQDSPAGREEPSEPPTPEKQDA